MIRVLKHDVVAFEREELTFTAFGLVKSPTDDELALVQSSKLFLAGGEIELPLLLLPSEDEALLVTLAGQQLPSARYGLSLTSNGSTLLLNRLDEHGGALVVRSFGRVWRADDRSATALELETLPVADLPWSEPALAPLRSRRSPLAEEVNRDLSWEEACAT